MNHVVELLLVEVGEQLEGILLDHGVHIGQQCQASRGDVRPDHAPVALVTLLPDEFEGLHACQEASNVGFGRDHPVADRRTRDPLRLRTTEDAEHVVLRGGDAKGPRFALDGALHAVRGAHEVEERFLRRAGKGALLGDFAFQNRHEDPLESRA